MNTLVALCAVGGERVLANEIKKLGYKISSNATQAKGRMAFTCDDAGLLISNLCLRVADRIYLQVARYKASNFEELFGGVYSINWQDYFAKNVKIVIDKVHCYKSILESEHTVQSMVHKAIYKKLGDIWHISNLPETGQEYNIRVYIENDYVSLLLDLSGEPLYKRGYRTLGGVAPLRETVAALLLLLMLWRRDTPLLDPFCGSGTILAEAILFAYNAAPCFGRSFSVETLPFLSKEHIKQIRQQVAGKIKADITVEILGSDIDTNAVKIAKTNIEHAATTIGRALQSVGCDFLVKRPTLQIADFATLKPSYPKGLILCNPPYGERLGDLEEAKELYKRMSSLFSAFDKWNIGVITSSTQFEQLIGHKSTNTKTIKSGKLDTYLYSYIKNKS